MIDTGILTKNPFPGIRPFTSAEDRHFFGREETVQEVLGLLKEKRFVTLVGPSASGKTSLIQSGLIPALITEQKQEWIPVTIRPGTTPLENLVRAFQQIFPKKLKETDVRSFLDGTRDLGDLIIEKGLGSYNYFLVVDQFEELFRPGPVGSFNANDTDTWRFVDLLVKFVQRERPGIHVMLSIRSDFVEAMSTFKALTGIMNRSKYLLSPMSREALSEAITGPLQQEGVRLEAGFVEYLLDNLDDEETPLPRMQHAMMSAWEVWRRRDDRDQPLSISDYQATGTVKLAITKHLEEAYEELNGRQQLICENLFKTITSKSDKDHGLTRQVTLGNIARIAQCSFENLLVVVEVFRRPGRTFLSPHTTNTLTPDSRIELAHESLIRIWERLHRWVDEEDESIKMYLKLSNASALYQQGRTELWKQPELREALKWREAQKPTPAWGVQHHPAFERAMVFLSTSEEELLWAEKRRVILRKRRVFLNRAIVIFMGTLVAVLAIVYYTTRNNPADEPATGQPATQDLAAVNEPVAEPEAVVVLNQEESASAGKTDQGTFRTEELIAGGEQTAVERGVDLETTREPSARERESSSTPSATTQSTTTSRSKPVVDTRVAEREYRRNAIRTAKRVARQSTDLSDSPELQGLLAYQAYLVNDGNNGNYYDTDIYGGLYAAQKQLISPGYNIYTKLTSSTKDIQWLHRTNSLLIVSSDGSVKSLPGKLEYRNSQTSLSNTGQSNECLVVSPDEQIAAVGTNGGGLLFLELENKGSVIHQNSEEGKSVLFLTNLGTTGSFLSAGTEHRIMKWDYSGMSAVKFLETDDRPSALAASRNGSKAAFGTKDGKLFELDVVAPEHRKLVGEYGSNYVKSIAYSPGGQYLVVGLRDGSLQVLSGSVRRRIATLRRAEASISDIAFSPNGRFLAVASMDSKVYLWHTADWNASPIVFDEENGFVLTVCFSGNSGYFYSGSNKFPRVVGRPSESALMAGEFCNLLKRNLTHTEWNQYFGGDIPYSKSCPGKN